MASLQVLQDLPNMHTSLHTGIVIFKDRIELGDELKDGHPYDVASLIKQFFRELPDPLLTAKLHDTFLKVRTVNVSQMLRNLENFSLCHFISFGVWIPNM